MGSIEENNSNNYNKNTDAKVNSNIASTLFNTSSFHPDEIALINKNRQWTFAEISQTSKFYAHFLSEQQIKKGDRVILMVKPSMEFICLTFALFSIGAVVILIDPGMGYKNLLKCIGNIKPKAFIAIPKAHIFKRLFPQPFKTVHINICVGRFFGLLGVELPTTPKGITSVAIQEESAPDDLAAIIFTTGSTGPPKGVRYEHRIFQAQLQHIKNHYKITVGDIDQPAFPLFALFSIALGAKVVIPEMDPTRPAKVNPAKFLETITRHGVSYSFGSPAIWNVISRYCLANGVKLKTLNKVLMAGAPVSGELIERVYKILPDYAQIHIPYGATESLPIVSISGKEVINKWLKTCEGKGTCVGKPLEGIRVKVIQASDKPITNIIDIELPANEIGEIIVQGDVVTQAYENNDAENRHSKIFIKDKFWHRMGDVGYFDKSGYLWFCGRKAHIVKTTHALMYTICCEAIFNQHPMVYRSALVGIGQPGNEVPVIIVELENKTDHKGLFKELKDMADQYDHTARIEHFLCHDSFPVDIRHNAKIFREKLAIWAAKKLVNNI